MPTSLRNTLKRIAVASAATVLLGVAAVPAAHAAGGQKGETTSSTDTATSTVVKDSKTSAVGRKIG